MKLCQHSLAKPSFAIFAILLLSGLLASGCRTRASLQGRNGGAFDPGAQQGQLNNGQDDNQDYIWLGGYNAQGDYIGEGGEYNETGGFVGLGGYDEAGNWTGTGGFDRAGNRNPLLGGGDSGIYSSQDNGGTTGMGGTDAGWNGSGYNGGSGGVDQYGNPIAYDQNGNPIGSGQTGYNSNRNPNGYDNTVYPETSLSPRMAGNLQSVQSDSQVIRFAYNQDQVPNAELYKVDGMVDYLMTYPDLGLVLEGHCDERGSASYNMSLGEKRAIATRNALIARGIASSRINTLSFGEEAPINPGHHEGAWLENRRVEMKLLQ